ncbi:hypothetical protein CTAYLR_008383 [Chrysophaeum taylorii]|uniref:Uncharacterized protein n=1 Tax=Chrysophaeum taylorii TaxID=2483200 RepID=A0AAD7UJX4_9STRA|nr:hypothetical protein CTAYLR_008383 [Chrysophaeum taylorii]
MLLILLTLRRVIAQVYGTSNGPKNAGFEAECETSTYYKNLDTSLRGDALKTALHELIKEHRVIPYTDDDSDDPNTNPDCWKAIEFLDEDANDTTMISSLYSRDGYLKTDHPEVWNREHTWPRSYAVGESGADYTDLHALRATGTASGERTANCEEPAHKKAAKDTAKDGELRYWLPPAEVRGDIARGLFYMETRYDGVDQYTENLALAVCPELYKMEDNVEDNQFHGDLDDLLFWHCSDPVDDAERARNDTACTYWQGNRNPFVDYPELVSQYYGDADVSFRQCRACIDAGADISCTFGASFSVCDDGAVASTTTIPTNVTVFINEFHYDNSGSDVNEQRARVELWGPTGLNLSGWSLELLYGNSGSVYETARLSGVIPDGVNGMGFVTVSIEGLQNGPDGMALVDDWGALVEFISYEGSFEATGGAAKGVASTDIGVAEESSSTSSLESVQRVGTGRASADFAWSGPSLSSFCRQNDGQTISAPISRGPGSGEL